MAPWNGPNDVTFACNGQDMRHEKAHAESQSPGRAPGQSLMSVIHVCEQFTSSCTVFGRIAEIIINLFDYIALYFFHVFFYRLQAFRYSQLDSTVFQTVTSERDGTNNCF